MSPCAIGLPLSAVLVSLVASAEAEQRQEAFNTHCRTCHSTRKDDHRLGPSMYGIFGARSERSTGFAYSGALSGLMWDEPTLDRFIADPRSFPGTTMIAPPVADPALRHLIIEYLASQAAAAGTWNEIRP